MERNFNIDINYLEEILSYLNEYGEDSDVLIDKCRLERMIKRNNSNFFYTGEQNLSEDIKDDLDNYTFYKPYYPFVKDFVNTGYSVEELEFERNYTPLTISDSEAFENAKCFFKEQGDFFSSGFEEFEEEAEDHLEFVEEDANTDGEVLFLKTTGDAFVFTPNYSDFTKAVILVHETEHVIDAFKNPNFFENTVSREIVSVFMEMIACDYLSKKYNLGNDGYQRKLVLHAIIKDQAQILIDKMEMLELIDNNRHLPKDELYQLLDDEGFSIECIKFLMERTIAQDFYYQIAQLIAIEIYFIYKDNKELALNILIDIILNGNDNNILKLVTKYGIILNKNVKRYEDKLLSKVKRQ